MIRTFWPDRGKDITERKEEVDKPEDELLRTQVNPLDVSALGDLSRGDRIGLSEEHMEQAKMSAKDCVVAVVMEDACGSGIVFYNTDQDIYVVTNEHVVRHWNEETSYLVSAKGRRLKAEVIFKDAVYDLGFLKIVPEQNTGVDFSSEIRIASYDASRETLCAPGDFVFFLGNKWENEQYSIQYYTGMIEDEAFETSLMPVPMLYAYGFVKPGMSGGGLFSEEGYLLGVITAGSEAQEVLAIPMEVVFQSFRHTVIDN